jgi:2-phosphosulfolactate phosphatase
LEIRRLSLIEGSKKATGLAVVIDVFRAFTTDAFIMANGAERIYPVTSINEAFSLKQQNNDWILIGERGGRQVPGFDYGNSPYDIKDIDFTGKTVIQTTSAGTAGLLNAYSADEILPGSFVIADAIVKYIQKREPETISLIAMGWGGKEKSPEDEALAEYIELRIRGKEPDFKSMLTVIRNHPEGAKFFDKSQNLFKKGDFYCAMDINRFNFLLKLVKEKRPFIIKVQPE